MMKKHDKSWLTLRRDAETGIESVNAHFKGHAYDPHDHDELLIGITQQGLQQFSCHQTLHTSTPGRAMLIEPGAVHDGHAPENEGFTYAMLYLPQRYMQQLMNSRRLGDVSRLEAAFRHTLTDDPQLINAIWHSFHAIHGKEGRLARDLCLDNLLSLLSRHILVRPDSTGSDSRQQMYRVRDYLYQRMACDIGLDELAAWAGTDRFRLSRQFKKIFGISPHGWLIRLRLRCARQLLASGEDPAQVALRVGFADQSHLGRWFQRAYRISPAAYQRQCTNVLS